MAGRWITLAATLALVAGGAVMPGQAIAAAPRSNSTVPWEPVTIAKIAVPHLDEASSPVFTRDGHHLLFFADLHLWIIADNGAGLRCLTCGVAHEPLAAQSEQEGFASPLADGKRVFLGVTGGLAMLECAPNVVNCATRTILPVDLSAVRPKPPLVGPGGANLLPALSQGGNSSPKLAPDGVHIAFSDIRSDAAELMTMATLTRTSTAYVAGDPHVLNPAGPTSPTDTNTQAWSDSAALYEFKSFARGGADGTYVQVGGAAALNPDVWSVNFATGKRTRLTSHADWDEDDAPSPDGRSILIESDRTMHRSDSFGGLLPFRGFIDAPQVAIVAAYFVAGAVDRQCDLQPWLFPARGDDHATDMGQPIQPYDGRDVHAANNISGYPQWSPDGTELALNTESHTTNKSAPYLLIAHLTSRAPTKPLPVVSSQPGTWSPAPADYHGTIGSTDTVVLHGKAAGTATVTYTNPVGVISGTDSVAYSHYSDDGKTFVDGTDSVVNPNILTGPITLLADLTIGGAHTGSLHTNLTFSGIATAPPVYVTGTTTATLDGTTVTGPPSVPAHCPRALPRAPHLELSTTVVGHQLRTHVSASVSQGGPAENALETHPVRDATLTIAGRTAHTDSAGNATLDLRGLSGRQDVRATAGDTLVATSRTLLLTNRAAAAIRAGAPAPKAGLPATGGNPWTPLLGAVLCAAGGAAVARRRLS